MLARYIQDKSPQIFRPRVTPDPTMQSRLAEKVREVMEKNQKYVGGHLVSTQLSQTKIEMA